MQVNVRRLEGNKALLEIEVGEDELEEALEGSYRKLRKKVNIPGFRKGKAPRALVERYVGRERLYDEALGTLIPSTYNRAVEQADVHPIDRPEVEVVQLEEGKPFHYKATVEVRPDVELCDYARAREGIEPEKVEVSEEQVDEQLERLRQAHAQLLPDESGKVKDGSFVVVDLEGTAAGRPFPREKVEGYGIEVGSGKPFEGFDRQLLGAEVGEEREVVIAIPEGYPDQGVAGTRAVFRVQVKELKRKKIPELDDDFAKQVGPYQTLQELREKVKNSIQTAALAKAERQYSERVVDKVVDESKVDVPDVLVKRQIDAMVKRMEADLRQRNSSIEEYLESSGHDEDWLREQFRPQAERIVKAELVQDAVARREGIEATEEDLEAEAKKVARLYGQSAEAVRKFLMTGDTEREARERIVRRKTINLLAWGDPERVPEYEREVEGGERNETARTAEDGGPEREGAAEAETGDGGSSPGDEP